MLGSASLKTTQSLRRRNWFGNPLFWILIVIILAAAGGGAYYFFSNQHGKDWQKNTVKVEKGSVDVRIVATGTIKPVSEIKISPKVTGLIKELRVRQGDLVRKGDIIARMDNNDLLGQIEAARGSYLMAQDNYEKVLSGFRPQEIAISRYNEKRAHDIVRQAEQSVIRLKAQVESMQQQQVRDDMMAERQSYLETQGAVSAQDSLNAETTAKITRANLEAATRELKAAEATVAQNTNEHAAAQKQAELTRIGNRKEDIFSAKHAVMQAKGQLDTMLSQLNDTTIRAPFDGVITQKYADAGAIVTPTTSAATTSATSSSVVALAGALEMVAQVAETDIGRIKIGQDVEIISNAYPELVFHGKVTQIAPEAVVTQNVTTFEVHTSIADDGVPAKPDLPESRHHRHRGKFQQQPEGSALASAGAVSAGPVAHDSKGETDLQGSAAEQPGRQQDTAEKAPDSTGAEKRDASADKRSQSKLLSGMNVSARFVGGQLNDVLLVPTVCIISKHGKSGVLIPDNDGTPKFKPVKTGASSGSKTAVMRGLKESDLVFLGLNKDQLEDQGYSTDQGPGGHGSSSSKSAPIPRSFR
jgi:HlyD family secretion protein